MMVDDHWRDNKGVRLQVGDRVEDVGTRGNFGVVEELLLLGRVRVRWDDTVDGTSDWPSGWYEKTPQQPEDTEAVK